MDPDETNEAGGEEKVTKIQVLNRNLQNEMRGRRGRKGLGISQLNPAARFFWLECGRDQSLAERGWR
jgi:hypothetical protein